jgi:Ni/Co efflux regulator RcnB
MKKILSILLSAGLLVAPMALVATPAAAKTTTHLSSQAQGAPAAAKSKHKATKAAKTKKAHKVKKAKKSKKSKASAAK